MGVSTHRFIMLMIAINLCIGIAIAIYKDPTTVDTTVLSDITGEYDQYEQDLQTEQAIYGTVKSSAERQQEPHVGNPLIWGKRIFNVLMYSIYPFGLVHFTYETYIETLVAWIISLFRSMILMLVALEAYMLFINKKQN